MKTNFLTRHRNLLLIACLLLCYSVKAQNYQAVHGSPYAGSLSPAANPAAIVHVPYAWDITPFSVQFKQSTNAFRIEKYSLLSKGGNAEIKAENGIKKRFVFANQDIHLLNTRINLHAKAAIAFGANIRNYVGASGSNSNYQDTSYSLADFMKLNIDHLPLSVEFTGSAWAELYGTYAQTVLDDGERLLNAGLTLKLNRSIAGGYARMAGVGYIPSTSEPGYLLTAGNLQYGYSANFDSLDDNKSGAVNRHLFLQNTHSSVSADIGLDYILLSSEEKGAGSDYAYETRIGVSLMDIGNNKYLHGSRSRRAVAGLPGITDTLIENKITTVSGFDDFNDSLGTISNSFSQPVGNFFIYKPTRLVVNIDQHIGNNFFINAELTLPLISLAKKNTLFIRDLNLLAVTPRWEVRSLGAYFPILFNTRQQLWVGGAFKAGPILFGTHNLGGLLSKNKAQTGGLYLALTIRPSGRYEREAHQRRDRLPAQERRRLNCPAF